MVPESTLVSILASTVEVLVAWCNAVSRLSGSGPPTTAQARQHGTGLQLECICGGWTLRDALHGLLNWHNTAG